MNFKFFVSLITCLILMHNLFAQEDSIAANETLNQSDVQLEKLKEIEKELSKVDQNLFANDFLIKELKSSADTLGEQETKRLADVNRRIKQLEESNTSLLAKKETLGSDLKALAKPYPVVLEGDTLFYFYLSAGIASAAQRATNTSKVIYDIYKTRNFDSTLLKAQDTELGIVTITYDNTLLFVVSKNDAYIIDKSPIELANIERAAIINAIDSQLKASSVRYIIYNILQVTGLIALILLIIWVLNKLMQPLKNWLLVNRKKYISPLRYSNTEIVDAHKMLELTFSLINIIKWVFVLIILYAGSFFVFSLFPDTKDISNKLISWIITPITDVYHGVLNFLPDLVTIIVIFMAFRLFIRFLKYLTTQVELGKIEFGDFPNDWARPTFNIFRFLLYAFMFIIIFPFLPGSDSPAFQGVSVFLGLLISLGSSSTISNIMSGIVITYMRPFQISQRVKVGDVTGVVISKNLLVTKIRSPKNEEITIPNANLLTGHMLNYSSACENLGLIIHTTVTIGYDVPWRKMHDALIDAVLLVPTIDKEQEPFVLQKSLDDFYVSYEINAYTREPHQILQTYSMLHQSIQDVCNERGIEIMSPHFRNVRDGNMTTIPEDYLDKNYTAPPFNIRSIESTPEKENKKNVE